MVDATLVDVGVRAAWVGISPTAGELVDVEVDIDAVLGWGDSIAVDGAEGALRSGPLLRGTVEQRERGVLTLRTTEGPIQVEVDNRSTDVPLGTAVAVLAEHLTLYPTGV